MPTFTFQDKKVHYRIYGEGEPLLLIHGNTASSKMFNSLIKSYKKHFRLILIDLPGHGKSERLAKFETDFWYYNAKACHGLIEELKLKKLAVIGSSGGALVALNLALEHPEYFNWIIADSFEGEYPLDSYINSIEKDRAKDKKKLLAKIFWYSNHGADWKKIIDQDTEVNIAFAKSGRSFFHRDLSTLTVKTLLTGSLQDEYCSHLDQIFKNLIYKSDQLDMHLFTKGNHPAILSNKKEYLQLVLQHFK